MEGGCTNRITMKKTFILLLWITPIFCFGQYVDTTFYHIGENEGINKIIFRDSVFTSLSATMINGKYNTVTLTDVNSSAGVVKYKNFTQPSNHFVGWDIARDYDHNLVIVGAYEINPNSTVPFVMKLTPDFDSLWIRYFDDPKVALEEGFNIQITPDSNYVCLISKVNFNKSQRVHLIKIDRSGHTLWEKQYDFGSESFQDPQALYVCKGGDIIIGWCNDLKANGIDYHQGKITKLNEKGEIKWTKTLDGDDFKTYTILQMSGLEDEGCVTAWVDDSLDNMAISRFDKVGNKLWQTTFPDNPFTFPDKYIMKYEFSEMALSHDRNILVSGYVRSKDFYDEIFLMKLDVNSGQLIWRKIYSADKFNTFIDYPRSLVATPDGRIALGTYREDETKVNKKLQNWLLVMDSLGCSVPNCEDSLINVMKLGVGNQDLGSVRQIYFKVGPNPVADFVNCYFFDAVSTPHAQLLMYDAAGKRLMTKILQSGEHFARLDLSQLTSGKYYICYSEKGRLKQSESVVVTK